MSAPNRSLFSKRVGSEPLNGDSALHLLARANSATGMTDAAFKCDINIKNNRLETPLIVAAQHSACRVVAKLVQLGADVNACDNQGNTALHYAVWNASEKTVVVLAMSAADVNIPNSDGQTVLHLLALFNNFTLARHICQLQNSINLDMTDRSGHDPFMVVVMNGSIRVLQYFLTLGYNPEKRLQRNRTPLHFAVELKNLNVVKLLAKLPHINLVDDSGHSALAVAISNGNDPAVDLLLQEEANIQQVDISGNTMLHIACAGPSVHIARHMLEHFPEINVRNLANETPLHLACVANNAAVVLDLCTRGADVTAQDNKNRTPLMAAIMSGNHQTALVLLKWEFVTDTNVLALVDDNDMSALQYCILFNDQITAARIRTIELALLSDQQTIPQTRTIYFRTGAGANSNSDNGAADPLELSDLINL